MPILREVYYNYVGDLNAAKTRIARDRKIIKYIHKMINTKHLSPGEKERLDKLLLEVNK